MTRSHIVAHPARDNDFEGIDIKVILYGRVRLVNIRHFSKQGLHPTTIYVDDRPAALGWINNGIVRIWIPEGGYITTEKKLRKVFRAYAKNLKLIK